MLHFEEANHPDSILHKQKQKMVVPVRDVLSRAGIHQFLQPNIHHLEDCAVFAHPQ
jgi:hypothetical protein